jgi:two-component system, NarL family, response regulator NreC
MTDQITVVIVDDHAIVRSGLRLLIEREGGMTVLDEAADANEAIFRVLEHKPDVVLIDVTMPGDSGIDAIPRLLEASPESKVLVLSMHDDPRYVRDAFAAGATGYVLKEAADAELVAAIRQIAGGGSYVNPALGARVVTSEAKEHAEALADPLSEREHQVLRLLALGHTNQEIAAALFISVRTAETHRAHIMQKLGLASRAELVRYALARQILEPE